MRWKSVMGKSKQKRTNGSKGVEEIVSRHRGEPRALIEILQDIQAEHNHLPRELLVEVAHRLGLPLNRVYSVASFYNSFSLVSRGCHCINVCLGTACHVQGSAKVAEQIGRVLGIGPGETTEDLQFTMERVNCLGACALGPVMVVDGKYHGGMTPQKVEGVLKPYMASQEAR